MRTFKIADLLWKDHCLLFLMMPIRTLSMVLYIWYIRMYSQTQIGKDTFKFHTNIVIIIPWDLLPTSRATPSSRLHSVSTASNSATSGAWNYSCCLWHTNTHRLTSFPYFYHVNQNSTIEFLVVFLGGWGLGLGLGFCFFVFFLFLLCSFLPDLIQSTSQLFIN